MFTLTLWLAIVYVSRYVSLGSIAAAFATPLAAYYLGYDYRLVVFTAFVRL